MLSTQRHCCPAFSRLKLLVAAVILLLTSQAFLAGWRLVMLPRGSGTPPGMLQQQMLLLPALSAVERAAPPLELLEVDVTTLLGESIQAVLAVHLHDPERTRAALRSWARPRRLQLVLPGGTIGVGDAALTPPPPPRFVTLHVLLFEASTLLADFDWAAEGLASTDVVHLPPFTRAGTRTFAAIAAALARHGSLAWLIKADDDTFLQVGRLLRALLPRNSSAPALLGSVLTQWGPYPFTSGGAGYAMSRAALDLIMPHAEPCDEPGFGTSEDVMMNVCVEKHAGGRAVIHDLAGLNYHTPENMLARNEYSDAHLEAAPMSHHYSAPARAAAMLQPRAPRLLLQIWPFDAMPGAAHAGASAADNAEVAVLAARAQACARQAAEAGFEYRLEMLYGASAPPLAARRYVAALTAPARELLAGLELLYQHGGARISLWARCDAATIAELVMLAVPAAKPPPPSLLRRGAGPRAHNATPRIIDALPSMQLGEPRGHAFRCLNSGGRACTAAIATQYNHDVFHATAALAAAIIRRNTSYYDAPPQRIPDASLSEQLIDAVYFQDLLAYYKISIHE